MASPAAWISQSLGSHDRVRETSDLGGGVVAVTRVDGSTVHVGVTSLDVLDGAAVERLCEHEESVHFVVNIPKDADFSGDLFEVLNRLDVGVGGVKDLFRALNEPDLRNYEDPESAFIEQILSQHGRIDDFERLGRWVYELHLRGGSFMRAHIESVYEVTAAAVRRAYRRDPQINAFVTNNPNCFSIASQAIDAGSQIGIEVMLWREFSLNLRTV